MEALISKELQKKGWWPILENKQTRNGKYIVLICIFSLLFFISMTLIFVKYHALSEAYKTASLSYRVESVALEETLFGAGDVLSALWMDNDYEPEFDSYWEFADIKIAYIRGRFADDKTPYIEQISNYIANCDNADRVRIATEYLDQIQ